MSFATTDARSYCATLTTGLTTSPFSFDDTILSFRSALRGVTRLTSLTVGIHTGPGAFPASNFLGLALFPARNWTTSDTAGIAATLTGDNAKAKKGQDSSRLVDLRVSNITPLTPGVRSIDGFAYAQANFLAAISVQNVVITPGLSILSSTQAPLEMLPNEGFIVALALNGYQTTGTIRYAFTVVWDEYGTE